MSSASTTGVGAALWRTVLVFRGVAAAESAVVTLAGARHYTHPVAAALVAAGYGAWALAVTWAARPPRRSWAQTVIVVADTAVTVAVTAATLAVASRAAVAAQVPTLAVAGLAGPVLLAALLAGTAGGLAAAAAVAVADLVVHLAATGRGPGAAALTGTATVLVFAGGVGGYLAASAQSAERVAVAATRETAAARARAELAAGVHDDVLQTLAMLSRDGGRLGAGEVSTLAAGAERKLRRLVSSRVEVPAAGEVDVVAAIADLVASRHSPPEVVLALPAAVVERDAAVVRAVTGAIGAALDNVATHAAGSLAYVGASDDGDTVTVWVRDDGPGIPDGRLDAAAGEGRLGVRTSIVERVTAVGGSAHVRTDGTGTEVEIRV